MGIGEERKAKGERGGPRKRNKGNGRPTRDQFRKNREARARVRVRNEIKEKK